MNCTSKPLNAMSDSATKPPIAPKVAHEFHEHGYTRQDPYFWMRERDTKPVLDYIEAENRYARFNLDPQEKMKDQIFQELKQRELESYDTFPVERKNYAYFWRYVAGKDYPLYVRRSLRTHEEQILLDENTLAEGKEFFHVSRVKISEDENQLLYTYDDVSRRLYKIALLDLNSNKTQQLAQNTGPDIEWARDGKHFWYVGKNPTTLREESVYLFDLGTHKGQEIFKENDSQFTVGLGKSSNKQAVYIQIDSTETSEYRRLDTLNPNEKAVTILTRKVGHKYEVDENDSHYFFLSNRNFKNFQILTAPKSQVEKLTVLISGTATCILENLSLFKGQLVWLERENAARRLKTMNIESHKIDEIKFEDPAYVVDFYQNDKFEADHFYFVYESMRVPSAIFRYDFATQTSRQVYQKPVPSYDSSLYKSERLWVTARDGVKIPVSLIYRKDQYQSKKNPILVYAYGSYGANMDPEFDRNIFSLLDRGFVYAIAHIRGGSEMGREWYENGRQNHKLNSFNDFIDATQELVKLGYANAEKVYARGGSAGGLLMGGVANMAPKIYHGIVAEVPFVDVLTTMLDETIPLTTLEYDEWGNPHKKSDYDYMAKYSPYDNVSAQEYPNMLITTGYHDSQVQYWEPLKWTARLREKNLSTNPIVLRVEMGAGHGGRSGRYGALEDEARVYAYLVHLNLRQ